MRGGAGRGRRDVTVEWGGEGRAALGTFLCLVSFPGFLRASWIARPPPGHLGLSVMNEASVSHSPAYNGNNPHAIRCLESQAHTRPLNPP